MGSSSTEVALVRYSTYGRSKINQFEVLDVEWDHTLGGNDLDVTLLRHFAAMFKEQSGQDVR